jgi:hypothetical protein
MESSAARLAANCENAQKSTGPRTRAGKARAAQNATRHGLLSRRVLLLPGEDVQEWQAFRQRWIEDYAPAGALEQLLLERATEMAWRLRRAAVAEAGVLRVEMYGAQVARLQDDIKFPMDPEPTDQLRKLVARRDREDNELGRAVVANLDVLTKLTRYETRLERSLHKTLMQLREEQSHRRRSPRPGVVTGPVIDVVPNEPAPPDAATGERDGADAAPSDLCQANPWPSAADESSTEEAP